MADFKDRLKQLREQKGMTQDDLAQRLQITKSAVSGWERGERHPRFDMLDEVADIFDCDINYLLGNSDEQKPYPRYPEDESIARTEREISDDERLFLNQYRRLSDYQKRLIDMIIKGDEK